MIEARRVESFDKAPEIDEVSLMVLNGYVKEAQSLLERIVNTGALANHERISIIGSIGATFLNVLHKRVPPVFHQIIEQIKASKDDSTPCECEVCKNKEGEKEMSVKTEIKLSDLMGMRKPQEEWIDNRTLDSITNNLLALMSDQRSIAGEGESSQCLIKLMKELQRSPEFSIAFESVAKKILELFPVQTKKEE